jgi:hypothetical protein
MVDDDSIMIVAYEVPLVILIVLHTELSDSQILTFLVSVRGGDRQVLLLTLGSNLSVYIEWTHQVA